MNSPWNQTLTEGVADFFLSVVEDHFLRNDALGLEYTWMRFLSHHNPIQDSLLTGLLSLIIEGLRKKPILRSVSGLTKLPASLIFIPLNFRNRDRKLLVGSSDNYLSFEYHVRDVPFLEILGVESMTFNRFLEELESMSKKGFAELPPTWHEDIASAVLPWPKATVFRRSNGSNLSTDQVRRLERLEIIPVQNGAWTSIAKGPIYFSNTDDHVEIPSDIDLRLVCAEPALSEVRVELYRNLGVECLKSESVVKALISSYRSIFATPFATNATNVTLEQSVGHVHYLFTVSASDDFSLMYLFNSSGRQAEIGTLYMDLAPDSSNSLRTLFGPLKQHSSMFIHSSYTDITKRMSKKEKSSYLSWLREQFSIAIVPRLSRKGKLSRDFCGLMDCWPSQSILSILRDNWDSYKSKVLESQRLRESIAHWVVNCGNGKTRQLSKTCLPIKGLTEIASKFGRKDIFSFTSISGLIELNEWGFLGHFGVQTEASPQFYVWVLMEIRDSEENWCHEKAEALYSQINRNHPSRDFLQYVSKRADEI